MNNKIQYSFLRTDKPKQSGYSHEIISTHSKEQGLDYDKLELYPYQTETYEGVKTLPEGFKKLVERLPNHQFLGTRVGDQYEWLTTTQTNDLMANLSHGIVALGLCPTVEAEGKEYAFMGIQAKNCKEWHLTGMACQH